MAPRSEAQKAWHKRNAERVKEKNKEWLEKNGGKSYAAKIMREWRERNKDHAKAKQAEYDKKRWQNKRDEMVAKMKDWKAKNPERWIELNRRSDLKKKYGLTTDEYQSLCSSQGNVCAICGMPQNSKRGPNLSVDHCHETGKIRALLCVKCNTGLGMFKDDPRLMERAAEYIRSHSKREVA